MRRREILSGLNQALNAIDASGVHNQLEAILTAPDSEKINVEKLTQLLESFKQYSIEADKFNEAARLANEVLSLHRLSDPMNWQRVLGPRRLSTIHSLFSIVNFAKTYVPKLVKLLEFDYPSSRVREGIKANEFKVLTVNLYEGDNVLSSPIRLANILESINHFYTACALNSGMSPSTLSVVACDSGSDKSFDFLGLASVMDCVERLIKTIFERVFFFREYQFDERLDLVAKALPIMEQIKRMEEHKEIAPEMAEILRRNIFDGTNKFIQSGATINSMEDKSEYDARTLLSPVPDVWTHL